MGRYTSQLPVSVLISSSFQGTVNTPLRAILPKSHHPTCCKLEDPYHRKPLTQLGREVASPGSQQRLAKLPSILREMSGHLLCIQCNLDHFDNEPRSFPSEGESGSTPTCRGVQGWSCKDNVMVFTVLVAVGSWASVSRSTLVSANVSLVHRSEHETNRTKMASGKRTAGQSITCHEKKSNW